MSEKRRSAFVRKMRARLKKYDAKITRLQANIQESRADREIENIESFERLKERRDEAAKKIEEIKESGLESWVNLKQRVKTAMRDLKQSFREAKGDLRNQRRKARSSE